MLLISDFKRSVLFPPFHRRPALRPLPTERFELAAVWSTAKVNIDYHIQFDDSFYSVPYQLTQQKVEVRATPTTVEIFHHGTRVASSACYSNSF
jgi:hypothetical protein